MELNFKNYQKLKIKNHLKTNTFLLFSIGANRNSQNWIDTEQSLHKLNLNYYKIYNNIAIKTIENSIYKNSTDIINSTFFYLTVKTDNFIKLNLLNLLKSIFFSILSVKLNNKIYSLHTLKNINSLTYKKNQSILYQFLLTNLKLSYQLTHKKTISKQCDSNT